MDIISIWSQWHSLSREQIEDKAFVQQVLGTKVVFCISAKDVPEEFKVDGQITDESLKTMPGHGARIRLININMTVLILISRLLQTIWDH